MSNYLTYLRGISPDKSLKRKIGYFEHNFRRHLRLAEPERVTVLEIGPGLGEFVAFLNGKGVRSIDIVDNDPSVLAHLAANFSVRNSHRADDLCDIEEALGRYDLIVAIQVFEHLRHREYRPFIQTLYRHLKAGGLIIITVPNGSNPLNVNERYYDITHHNAFTENSLRQLVNWCDLSAAEATVQGYRIPPTHPLNVARIVLQKGLHWLVRLLIVVNGGVYPAILTPNITLLLRKKRESHGGDASTTPS